MYVLFRKIEGYYTSVGWRVVHVKPHFYRKAHITYGSSEAVVKVSNNKIATIAKHNNAYKSASFFVGLQRVTRVRKWQTIGRK